MKRNIAYKADGTEETGKKIIDALMALGGSNPCMYVAMSKTHFFYLDNNGEIISSKKIPFCYELKSLDEQKNIADVIDEISNQMMELLSKL